MGSVLPDKGLVGDKSMEPMLPFASPGIIKHAHVPGVIEKDVQFFTCFIKAELAPPLSGFSRAVIKVFQLSRPQFDPTYVSAPSFPPLLLQKLLLFSAWLDCAAGVACSPSPVLRRCRRLEREKKGSMCVI